MSTKTNKRSPSFYVGSILEAMRKYRNVKMIGVLSPDGRLTIMNGRGNFLHPSIPNVDRRWCEELANLLRSTTLPNGEQVRFTIKIERPLTMRQRHRRMSRLLKQL